MAGLTPHLGTSALRAASKHALALMRGGCTPTGLESSSGVAAATVRTDSRDACFALGSASILDFSRVRRVQRLGLGLRSPPANLAIDPAFDR